MKCRKYEQIFRCGCHSLFKGGKKTILTIVNFRDILKENMHHLKACQGRNFAFGTLTRDPIHKLRIKNIISPTGYLIQMSGRLRLILLFVYLKLANYKDNNVDHRKS